MKPILRVVARLAVGALLAIGPIVIGCNNDDDFAYSSGGFGGSSGSTKGFVDAASPPELCDRAKLGNACGISRFTKCEIGTSANFACNQHLNCSNGSSGLWEADEDVDLGPVVCASTADCPADSTQPAADLCASPTARSQICEYQEGTCGCAPVGGVTQPPEGDDDDDDEIADAGTDGDAADDDAGDADAPDASDASDADALDAADAAAPDAGPRIYEWKCVTPAAGCPRTRPRAGLRCVRPMTCDYGHLVFEDGVVMNCNNGTWVRE